MRSWLNKLREFVEERIQEIIDKIRGEDKKERDYSNHPIYKVSHWRGGVNMSSATVDPNYKLHVSPDGGTWSEMPADWKEGGEMTFPAMCAAAYQLSDGTWIGGKYEWLPRPPRPRSWDNIKNGYNGWRPPQPGTEVWVWAYTYKNGNRASNAVKLKW